jgi:hypothetical protein
MNASDSRRTRRKDAAQMALLEADLSQVRQRHDDERDERVQLAPDQRRSQQHPKHRAVDRMSQ